MILLRIVAWLAVVGMIAGLLAFFFLISTLLQVLESLLLVIK